MITTSLCNLKYIFHYSNIITIIMVLKTLLIYLTGSVSANSKALGTARLCSCAYSLVVAKDKLPSNLTL